MSNQWSDNLRKRMETHQESSPEGLWDDIERIIQQDKLIAGKPKQNKVLLWSKRIGPIAAAIAVMIFIGNYFILDKPSEMQVVIQRERAIHTHNNNLSATDKNSGNEFIERKTNNRISSRATKLLPGKSLHHNDESSLLAKVNNEEKHVAESPKEDSADETVTAEKISNNEPDSKKVNRSNNKKITQEVYFPEIERQNTSGKWDAGIYASNISSNSAKKNQGYGTLVRNESLMENLDQEPVLGENPQSDIFIQNKYREVYTDIKHKQPVTMGISVNYDIDDKWSLTSGFIYTILSSELRSGSDSYYYKSEQTLHNIGVPLNINYSVWKNKRVSFYLSAGGLVEKNISGRLTTDYFIDNQMKSGQKDKISIDQLQWSVNTAVGAQYNFSDKIGLYVEPGMSYYFKNGSEVETIYKENPLNLSLRFGVRFSFNQ